MYTLKKCLKAAKSAIEDDSPEEALECVSSALEFDPDCYFAYIFQGKAHQLLGNNTEAIKSFEKATQIEPSNLLGWKGYYQVVSSENNYEMLCKVITSVIKIKVDQTLPIADDLKDLRNWLHTNNYKSDPTLHAAYLRSILPGTELADLVGNSLGNPETIIRSLIDIEKKRLDTALQKHLAKERVKFGRVLTIEGKNQLNRVSWAHYQQTDLPKLYEMFLNTSNDDELREIYEEDYLKVKYELFKASPDKSAYYNDVKEMIEGMIFVKTKSLFCWNLYFDWVDVKNLGDLDLENIIFYLKHFQSEGLGKVLYAFVMSDISPFDKSKIVKEIARKPVQKAEKISETEEEAKLLVEDADDRSDSNELNMLPGQVLAILLQGYNRSSDSVLANRIVCEYYIHLREYAEASDKCRESIRVLADLQRSLGIDLVNTKESFLCSLAIVYTYHEAPKNFSKALQLYDKILETNPENIKAQIGKGLILVEKGNLDLAKHLLEGVIKSHPDNTDAQNEYGWCLVLLGDYVRGREVLLKCLEAVKGVDLSRGEIRAVIQWRIAKSLLSEASDNTDFVNQAYGYLVESLKESKNYAPSYTLLGVLLQDHYGDIARAQKCFYKAFELDATEILSAKYLVEDLTTQNEWDIAEVLCNRIVSTENSRRILLSESYKDSDKAWPYRVLGCSALNKQDDAKAIEWFQTALRMTNMDANCWIGLGEAYYNCGRLDASAKVFRHTLTFSPDNWVAKYMLGQVLCQMEEFEEGLEFLNSAFSERPKEECILSALYDSYIGSANKFVSGGFFGRAMEANLQAIEFLKAAKYVNCESQNLWKSLGESLRIFLVIQEQIGLFPLASLEEIFQDIDFEESSTNIYVRELNDADKSTSLSSALKSFAEGDYIESISQLIILTNKAGIYYLPSKVSVYLRSVAFYNVGLGYLEGFNFTENQQYRELSVKFLKKAIQLEGNNPLFWITLGNAYVSTNPQISQHCFIKAISLRPKDGSIWTNLAALYLRYGDSELAQESFLRAQSIAPQDCQSWLGHALAAEAAGDSEKASRLFTHAFILSNGRTPLAQLLYALSILEKTVAKGVDPRSIEPAQEFSVANFAMEQYLMFAPQDEFGLQIALGISERCKQYKKTAEIGERLCSVLEKKYEQNESEVTLMKYADAKTQLARTFLGLAHYEKAIENAQFAINLIDDGESSDGARILLSSRIVIGLGLFFNNEFDEALQQFKLILTDYSDSKRLVTLVSQILYAYGTEETKVAAMDQLFAFIEEQGSSLIVVLTLGAISVVDNLDDYLGAIKDELEGLSLSDIVADSFKTVPKLLSEINARLGNTESDQIWQKNALLFPSDYNVWKRINSDMALTVASLSDTKITATELTSAYIANGRFREIQRSIILLPGNEEAVRALQGCM